MRKTACVTGGSGYIASALIKVLLDKGYAVKTTVRNPDDMEKNSHLKDLQALGRPLEVFRADLEEEGSFDEAVAGCDYAFLVAAPATPHPNHPDVIEAAARGALNVMRSCLRAGTTTVKRVVLTSSASAVSSRPLQLQGDGGRHVLQEDSWADVDYLTATKPAGWVYTVSRVVMEKEACRFAQDHGIDLVTVCPVATVGKAPAASKIPATVRAFLSFMSGDEAAFGALKRIETGTGGGVPLVHVDDVCRAEVFVAEERAAAGRYICCCTNTTVTEIAGYLPHQYPQYAVKTAELMSGGSGGDLLVKKPRVCLSSAKLVKEGFDFKYNLPDEIYDDMIDYGKAIGILPSELD